MNTNVFGIVTVFIYPHPPTDIRIWAQTFLQMNSTPLPTPMCARLCP